MPPGNGQSNDYRFINLRAHYLHVSGIPRSQTIQPPGVDAPSAKCRNSNPRAAAIAGEISGTYVVFSVYHKHTFQNFQI